MTREQVAQLLLLSDEELDKKIWTSIKFILFSGRWVVASRLLLQSKITIEFQYEASEFPVKTALSIPGIGIFKKYLHGKNLALSWPGHKLAKFVRSRRKDGGLKYCESLDYCRRKAWWRERFDVLDSTIEERGAIVGQCISWIAENIPDGQELIDSAKEFADELADEAVGFIFPGAACIKVFKYGLDDLCPCCSTCVGAGVVNENRCNKCGGGGFRMPFIIN